MGSEFWDEPPRSCSSRKCWFLARMCMGRGLAQLGCLLNSGESRVDPKLHVRLSLYTLMIRVRELLGFVCTKNGLKYWVGSIDFYKKLYLSPSCSTESWQPAWLCWRLSFSPARELFSLTQCGISVDRTRDFSIPLWQEEQFPATAPKPRDSFPRARGCNLPALLLNHLTCNSVKAAEKKLMWNITSLCSENIFGGEFDGESTNVQLNSTNTEKLESWLPLTTSIFSVTWCLGEQLQDNFAICAFQFKKGNK